MEAWGEQSIHHALKYPETTCKAMFKLHARPAFSSSSETETANTLPAQNRTWYIRPGRETTPSGAMLHCFLATH